MKIKLLYSLIGFIICTAFNTPKTYIIKSMCTDYRDVYVGTYFCHSESPHISFSANPKTVKDTISINVSKDAIDSILQIGIGLTTYKFKLKSNVLYAYPENDGHRSGKFFASDSVVVNIMGRASALLLKGKKN